MAKGNVTTDAIRQWVGDRLRNADRLVSQRDAGMFDADDAQILLCAAVAAMAADHWPRNGDPKDSDHARFVQFLIEYGSSDSVVTFISIPYLLRLVSKNSKFIKEREILTRRTLYVPQPAGGVATGRVGTGPGALSNDMDADADVVEAWLAENRPLTEELRKTVRKASYASIIYRDLRCGLVHEHRRGEALGRWSVTIRSGPHYVLAFDGDGTPGWRLCLPYEYVRKVVEGVLLRACDWLDGSPHFVRDGEATRPHPGSWWIDPGPLANDSRGASAGTGIKLYGRPLWPTVSRAGLV